jgi:thioredoxin 1
VVRIDVDQHRELARHYGVSSIPRLMVFHHGQVLADRVGYADHNQLARWVTDLRTQ